MSMESYSSGMTVMSQATEHPIEWVVGTTLIEMNHESSLPLMDSHTVPMMDSHSTASTMKWTVESSLNTQTTVMSTQVESTIQTVQPVQTVQPTMWQIDSTTMVPSTMVYSSSKVESIINSKVDTNMSEMASKSTMMAVGNESKTVDMSPMSSKLNSHFQMSSQMSSQMRSEMESMIMSSISSMLQKPDLETTHSTSTTKTIDPKLITSYLQSNPTPTPKPEEKSTVLPLKYTAMCVLLAFYL